MMQIEIRYYLGDDPYTVGGNIDNLPFEATYSSGFAKLVVLTENFVLTTHNTYFPNEGELDSSLLGQLIFELAQKLSRELDI